MTPNTTIIVSGFGRQKIFPAVGHCIYCFASGCQLGDEHIIPQALGGNLILPKASCPNCERTVGAHLEGKLTHKTKGMFAAMRLRLDYKSKRPKDRPRSLPFTVTRKDGTQRVVDVPATIVPRYWISFITKDSPGIILGRGPHEPALAARYSQIKTEDLLGFAEPGERVEFRGSGDARDLARFLAKIAHAMAVAAYGLDAFEPWLPKFILGEDDCSLHYYVAGFENKALEHNGDHRISLGTWADDGIRIGATIRLFCRYGSPDYEVAVGRFKEPRSQRPYGAPL